MSLANIVKRKGQWRGKLFPSGDFTIGRNQPPRTDKASHPLDDIGSHTTFYGARKVSIPARDLHKDFDAKVLEKISIAYQEAGNQELADRFGDRYAFEILNPSDRAENIELPKGIEANNQDCYGDDWSNMVSGASAPMGLSDVVNSHKSSKKKAKRGSKGISSNAKRLVRSSLTLLEKQFGRGCLSFGTATLPPMETHELEKICLDWSNITRKFFQELTRLLDRRGLSQDFIQVTEIQEKRYLAWGQVCPHLHWIMQGRQNLRSHWLITPDEIRSLWERILTNCLGRPIDCKAATRIEKPKKFLAVELGKYMSKGGKLIKQIATSDKAHLLPSSYWGSSKALKKQVKAAIKIIVGDECEAFIDSLESLKSDGLASYIHIFREMEDGYNLCIGLVGWVRVASKGVLSLVA
jgi:hypothetical protein